MDIHKERLLKYFWSQNNTKLDSVLLKMNQYRQKHWYWKAII